jgi:PKD repeat protein
LEVCFTDASSGTPTSWSWDFGDGGSSTAQNPCHTYDTPGSYDVALTVCNSTDCDTETKLDYVQVGGVPAAAFSADVTTGCAPLTVCFTDASSDAPTSWSWSFGDGGSSTAQNPCHTYDTPGSYDVSLTVCNDCGCDAMTMLEYISVSGPPVADFSAAPTRGHAPLEVLFTDQSCGSPTSWFWEFGDGGTIDQANHDYTYDSAGRYTVRLTVSNGPVTDVKEEMRYILVSFTDVPITPADPENHWALNQILACVEFGIVQGYPEGTYRPLLEVTRGQMAVFISRALAGGDPGVPTGPPTATFPDVPTDHWAYKYIEYAVERGVVEGYPDGTYRPERLAEWLTRDQMAVFIARAMCGGDEHVPTGPPTAYFPDVPTTHWAFKYVEYIRGEGVTGGYPDTKYHPEYACTRDQMAVFVQRAFHLPM